MIILPGMAMLKGRLRHPLGLVSLGARGLPTFPHLVLVVGTRRGGAGAGLIPVRIALLLRAGRGLIMRFLPWMVIYLPRKPNHLAAALPLTVVALLSKMLVGSLGTPWSPLGLLALRGPPAPSLPVFGTGKGEAGASWTLARTVFCWQCKLICRVLLAPP